MSKDIMKVITQVDFYGKILNVYGLNKRDAYENPKFLAIEVAEIIDYAKTGNGNYDVSSMLENVDDEEKVKIFCSIEVSNSRKPVIATGSSSDTTNSRKPVIATGSANRWFLKEEGLYELLMISHKPIAKEWKKEVKRVLKEYRLSYQDYIFTGQRFKSAKDHNELHDLIGDKGKCINLDKFLYNLCSYLLDLSEINRKDAIYQLKKSNITLYNQIMSSAYSYIKSYKRINKEHFIGITKEALLEEFVDDIDKYNEYILTHKVAKDEFIVQRGFGR